jgi:hypothetical protein
VVVPFTTDELELIAATKEVFIETRSGERVYRTVIWVAVDDEHVYVRSVSGESGRWYQRALADPEVTLDLGDTRLLARAIPVTDDESVELASEGFNRKYPRGRSLDAMIRPEVLDSTLRLDAMS